MMLKLRSYIAVLLCFILILASFAGCAETGTPNQTEAPTEPTRGGTVINPGFVVKPTEPPEPLPEPIVPEEKTEFPEAFELLIYLKAFTDADAAAYGEKITGAQAVTALKALGLSSPSISAGAKTVTGAQLLIDVMKLLGYTGSDFVGAYPTAQMTMLRSMDLDRGLAARNAGDVLDRRDSMYLF